MLVLCSLISHQAKAQSGSDLEKIIGTVSFVTSQNIYLRFENTAPLQIEDTLFSSVNGHNEACLILKNKSSVSCVAQPIGDCTPKKGDKLIYYYTPPPVREEKTDEVNTDTGSTEKSPIIIEPKKPEVNYRQNKLAENIDGKVSLSNYTTLGLGGVNSRSVARIMLDAEHIGDSKFSVYSYSYFRYNTLSDSGEIRNGNRLNIYELSLRYDYDSSLTLSMGRTINRRMYSVGAMDGISVEKRWKNIYTGIVAGSRPDVKNFGLNFNLFQYGAYAGFYHDPDHRSSSNIGFINQTNAGATDRRYLYFQHRSALGKKVHLFASSEIDLYEKDTSNIVSNKLRLTSVYLSLRYRVNSKFSLMASYDVRKNLILYESFTDNLGTLTTNDPYRGGLRLRANYRFTKNIYSGISFSNRSQSDGKNNFTNANLFLNISELPGIGGSLMNTFSINNNYSYQYYSLSTRYSKYMANNQFSLSPSARVMMYHYNNFSISPFLQLYLGLDAYYNISKTWRIGAMYEFSASGRTNYNRFNTHLIKRF